MIKFYAFMLILVLLGFSFLLNDFIFYFKLGVRSLRTVFVIYSFIVAFYQEKTPGGLKNYKLSYKHLFGSSPYSGRLLLFYFILFFLACEHTTNVEAKRVNNWFPTEQPEVNEKRPRFPFAKSLLEKVRGLPGVPCDAGCTHSHFLEQTA